MMSLRWCYANFPAVTIILYALKYCTMPQKNIRLCVYLKNWLAYLSTIFMLVTKQSCSATPFYMPVSLLHTCKTRETETLTTTMVKYNQLYQWPSFFKQLFLKWKPSTHPYLWKNYPYFYLSQHYLWIMLPQTLVFSTMTRCWVLALWWIVLPVNSTQPRCNWEEYQW